jgi:hypothetical protein
VLKEATSSRDERLRVIERTMYSLCNLFHKLSKSQPSSKLVLRVFIPARVRITIGPSNHSDLLQGSQHARRRTFTLANGSLRHKSIELSYLRDLNRSKDEPSFAQRPNNCRGG